MNKHWTSFAACAGLLLVAPAGFAQPVEYVRVCSIYGSGFHYIPGTDVCRNDSNGDTRQQTEGGTWRSILPYPEGKWVMLRQEDCTYGRVVTLGTFRSSDFSDNPWHRKQTRAIPVNLYRNEFVSRVIFSGGFQDPRLPIRRGSNGSDGLCVRSVDDQVQNTGGGPINPPFGNGGLPIGCVANSRILNMPLAYSVSATAAYPNIDAHYLDAGQSAVGGPYTYGSKLVVTTDFGSAAFQQLVYHDARSSSNQPLAGSVTVSVCVQRGSLN